MEKPTFQNSVKGFGGVLAALALVAGPAVYALVQDYKDRMHQVAEMKSLPPELQAILAKYNLEARHVLDDDGRLPHNSQGDPTAFAIDRDMAVVGVGRRAIPTSVAERITDSVRLAELDSLSDEQLRQEEIVIFTPKSGSQYDVRP